MTNHIDTLHELIPVDYDFDKDQITDANKVSKMIGAIVQANELKVETHENGDKHFMARIQGEKDENGCSHDDVADFILKPDFTIEYAFTGSDGSDESDWIFIGQEGGRADQWEDGARARLDVEARAFMDKFDYPKASLDEWLMEHGHEIGAELREEGTAIMERYPEYGGDYT